MGRATADCVATFSYDPLDNTLLKWYQGQYPQTMTYNVASHQVTMILVAATGFIYDCESRLLKETTPAFAVTTYTNGGDGLRGSYQKPGQPAKTMVWDGSDYLGEI